MENEIAFIQKHGQEKYDAYIQKALKAFAGFSAQGRFLCGRFYSAILEEWGWTCIPPGAEKEDDKTRR